MGNLRSTAGGRTRRDRITSPPAGTRQAAAARDLFTPAARQPAAQSVAYCLGVSARRAESGGVERIRRTDPAAAGMGARRDATRRDRW
jgi:hypothetical protein